MDTLGIEPRASRMLSGCDTTTPTALMIVCLILSQLARACSHRRDSVTEWLR